MKLKTKLRFYLKDFLFLIFQFHAKLKIEKKVFKKMLVFLKCFKQTEMILVFHHC